MNVFVNKIDDQSITERLRRNGVNERKNELMHTLITQLNIILGASVYRCSFISALLETL